MFEFATPEAAMENPAADARRQAFAAASPVREAMIHALGGVDKVPDPQAD